MSKRSKAVQASREANGKRRIVPEAPLADSALRLLRPDGVEILLGSLRDQVYSMQDEQGWQYYWSVAEATRRALTGAEWLVFSLTEAGITPEVIRRLYDGMDETFALTRDLSCPLLFVPLGESHQLIDGWHRLFKAATQGVNTLPALLLSQEDADASLVVKLPPGQGLDWNENDPAVAALYPF